jgi:hypothetical protein
VERVDTRLLQMWERSHRRQQGARAAPRQQRERFLELLGELRGRLAVQKAALDEQPESVRSR